MTRLDRADMVGACRGLLVLMVAPAAIAWTLAYLLSGTAKPAEANHQTIYRPAVEPARPTQGEY